MSSVRDFSTVKRLVIKVGTNVLTRNAAVDTEYMRLIAGQISQQVQQKRQVILVTSGAIGMGSSTLGIKHKVKDVKMRQALAAVGQGILMHHYQQAFELYGQTVAQVLLTNKIMSNRKYYVNLKNAVEKLLSLNIVPIINENDCVSIDEIDLAFGDNDRLSALVASKIDAELLVILTDVAGLYNRNPSQDKNAQLLTLVPEITDEIRAMAGKAGSTFSTGGMASKLNAINIAAQGGCKTILAHGRENDVITRIMNAEEIGTLFLPKRRLSNRKRWILNSSTDNLIEIDTGAAQALRDHRSLLFVGITAVRGTFAAGQVVRIGSFAKGICRISSVNLQKFLNEKAAGDNSRKKTVIHADDIVLL